MIFAYDHGRESLFDCRQSSQASMLSSGFSPELTWRMHEGRSLGFSLCRAQVNEAGDLELPKPHQNPDVSAQLFSCQIWDIKIEFIIQ